MSSLHFQHWPKFQPHSLTLPATNLFYNVEVSATRFPDKPYIIYYDTPITYARFRDECEHLAGVLQQECGVAKGDRVLLYLQNSPQFIISYYAILRAGAVVVPVNPMNMTEELRHYVRDTGATTAIAPQDLLSQILPLMNEGLRHVVVAAYSDYLERPTTLKLPDIVSAPRERIAGEGIILWSDAMQLGKKPGPLTTGPDDLCVMPYTSGTTGNPKGCMHTHRNVMYNTVASMQWFNSQQDSVALSVLPFFHVTGMQGSMNGPLYCGATIILLTRWDRDTVAQCIQKYRITAMQLIAAMVVDLLHHPDIDKFDLSSLLRISGGGAAMPEAVAQMLNDRIGVPYVEGYGMSETIAPSHANPMHRPKKQCLGIPIYDVDSRVIDPVTMQELPQGEVGEIIISGPQVMQGYWNAPAANAETFLTIDGKRFLRTGDLGRIDEDGYFFMVDRLKRMINASGFKVWPAEVEAMMYQHPAIREACVIGTRDPKRGETVKALVVLKDGFRGKVSEQEIVAWAHGTMAAYKSPRIVEFVDALPKSGTGKVQWRQLQDEEYAREKAGQA